MADKIPQSVIDTLIAEAYAEGPEGMRRVAETILNRAAIRGLSLEEVVTQRHQYTGYSAPGDEARKAQRDPKARSAAEAAIRLAMQPGDPTGGADHYYAPGSVAQPRWARSMEPKGDFGGHRFYSSRDVPTDRIPNIVAAYTDTTRPITPVLPTPIPPMLNAQRNLQPLNPDVNAIYNGFYPAPALSTPRPPVTNNDLIRSTGISDTVRNSQALEQQNHSALDAALEREAAARSRPPVPPMPMGQSQSYAGVERSLSRPVPAMPIGAPQSYASAERAPTGRPVPPMPIDARQSFAAQERGPGPAPRLPPVSRMSMAEARTDNGQGTLSRPIISTIAKIPTSVRLPPIPSSRVATPRDIETTFRRVDEASKPELTAVLNAQPLTPQQIASVPYSGGSRVASVPTTPPVPPRMTTAQVRSDNGQGIPMSRPPAKPSPRQPTAAERAAIAYVPPPATTAQVAAVPYGAGTQVASIPTTRTPPPVPARIDNSIPGPNGGFKILDRQAPGSRGLPAPWSGAPAVAAGTVLRVTSAPAAPPTPVTGFPTNASFRPSPVLPPSTRPPLEVLVEGANTQRPAAAAPRPVPPSMPTPRIDPSFAGVSTGRPYTPGGAPYQMGGQPFAANPDGTFTNLSTGQTLQGSSNGIPRPSASVPRPPAIPSLPVPTSTIPMPANRGLPSIPVSEAPWDFGEAVGEWWGQNTFGRIGNAIQGKPQAAWDGWGLEGLIFNAPLSQTANGPMGFLRDRLTPGFQPRPIRNPTPPPVQRQTNGGLFGMMFGGANQFGSARATAQPSVSRPSGNTNPGFLSPEARASTLVGINSSNHDPAQLAAVAAGRSYYTGSDGGMQPTHSIGGKLRNTY